MANAKKLSEFTTGLEIVNMDDNESDAIVNGIRVAPGEAVLVPTGVACTIEWFYLPPNGDQK